MLNLKIAVCLLPQNNIVIRSLKAVTGGQVDTEKEGHSLSFGGGREGSQFLPSGVAVGPCEATTSGVAQLI